jgi:proteasome lid subunit RPN8/RPN11
MLVCCVLFPDGSWRIVAAMYYMMMVVVVVVASHTAPMITPSSPKREMKLWPSNAQAPLP